MKQSWVEQQEALLPPLVESKLLEICEKQNQPRPEADVIRQLAAQGEESAMKILTIISKSEIRSLGGFIIHMIKKHGSSSSSSPSPSKTVRSAHVQSPGGSSETRRRLHFGHPEQPGSCNGSSVAYVQEGFRGEALGDRLNVVGRLPHCNGSPSEAAGSYSYQRLYTHGQVDERSQGEAFSHLSPVIEQSPYSCGSQLKAVGTSSQILSAPVQLSDKIQGEEPTALEQPGGGSPYYCSGSPFKVARTCSSPSTSVARVQLEKRFQAILPKTTVPSSPTINMADDQILESHISKRDIASRTVVDPVTKESSLETIAQHLTIAEGDYGTAPQPVSTEAPASSAGTEVTEVVHWGEKRKRRRDKGHEETVASVNTGVTFTGHTVGEHVSKKTKTSEKAPVTVASTTPSLALLSPKVPVTSRVPIKELLTEYGCADEKFVRNMLGELKGIELDRIQALQATPWENRLKAREHMMRALYNVFLVDDTEEETGLKEQVAELSSHKSFLEMEKNKLKTEKEQLEKQVASLKEKLAAGPSNPVGEHQEGDEEEEEEREDRSSWGILTASFLFFSSIIFLNNG
ncbi:uncharacterized protein LOC126782790 isoform X2 [Argentina anserina]|uniref:uncharacterized protein LOC126782790 isoform X2 n=1 Tax=Argentina anserina TaxID=57926 RepID=UPI0021762D43|nr:uncharacterized protein LOC126782790 isoform X2 [Potentilla anserina]